jgi:hypothetical protein
MSSNVALLVIEKTMAGEVWSNTHALANGTGAIGTLTDGDIVAMLGDATALTDANTNPASESYIGALSAIATVIGYERIAHSTFVSFTRLYLSDGKTPGPATGAFASFPLAFQGLHTLGGTVDDVAPLNVCLQVNRLPSAFSRRPGRLDLRGAINKANIKPASHDGVAILTSAKPTIAAEFTSYPDTSGLTDFLTAFGAEPATVRYVIPRYSRTVGLDFGKIAGFTECLTLQLGDAVSRQLPRGKRR